MLVFTRTDSDSADFLALVVLLDQELAVRDGDDHAFYAQFNKVDKLRHCIVGYLNGYPVASGAIREYEPGVMEVKRMYVRTDYRGQNIAGAVLRQLETWAGELGYQRCILETGKNQPEAIRLYQKSGYQSIPNYGQYAGIDNSVCMEKWLDGAGN